MNSDISDEFAEEPQLTDKPRKRQVNKAKWKKNVLKEAKYSAKALKEPTISCEHNNHFCAAKRLHKHHKDDLLKFHDAYWKKKDAISQKSFLMNYIDVMTPERQRPGQGKSQRSTKKKTIFYRIQTRKGPVKVCRDSFLSILNVGRRKVENAAHDKINFCYAVPETRGGARHKLIDMKEKVIAHIKKFKCRSNHYGRKKAPLRKYLPSELSIRKMWQMFRKEEKLDEKQQEKLDVNQQEKLDENQQEKLDDGEQDELDDGERDELDDGEQEKLDDGEQEELDGNEQQKLDDNEEKHDCNYYFYYNIFTTKFNLGFGTVKKDTCNDCLAFSTKFKAATDVKVKKLLIVERMVHLHKANKFFKCLNETPPRTLSIIFDLMQNQPLPKTQINQAYYSRQLWYYVLGLIIHTATKALNPETVHFYRWLESDGGRGCDEISSCLWDFFVKIIRPICVAENIECIRMFSDSCVGQNRNYCVLSIFSVIASQFNLKVEWYFPVRGHSYMPADRAFGLVETQIRDIDLILLPENYDEVFSRVGTVHVLGPDFHWLNWQELSKKTVAVKKSFKISKAKKISVYPKSGLIGMRENYMEPLCKHTILKRGKSYREIILSLTEKDRKSHVTEKKKQDIIKLLKVMGHVPIKIPFFREALKLKENDNASDRDDDEEDSTSGTDSE